jgi:hypothetical protein
MHRMTLSAVISHSADDAADEDLTALPTMEESAPAAGAGAAARPMRRRGWALPSMSRSPATHRTKPARFPPQRQRLPRWRGAFSLRVGRSGAHHSGSPQAAAGTFDGDTLEMERPSFEEPEATTTTASDMTSTRKPGCAGCAGRRAGVAGARAAAPTDDFGTDDFGTSTFGASDTATATTNFPTSQILVPAWVAAPKVFRPRRCTQFCSRYWMNWSLKCAVRSSTTARAIPMPVCDASR